MLARLGIGRWSRAGLCLAIAGGFALAGAGSARAAFITGIDSDGLFTSSDANEAAHWFDVTTDLNAGIVRLDMAWSVVATRKPANPADPADPAYDFSSFDRAVQDAAARGLQVMIVISHAPEFAQERGGVGFEPGSWKPDPDQLRDFAQAVAARYSGSFTPGTGGLLGGSALPQVSYYEAWNEPNLNTYLAPQYEDGRLVAADRYRRLVNAVDAGIDAVNPGNQVIVGSMAPYGDEPGGDRTRPVEFLRNLLCLNDQLQATACPTKTNLDIFSHHPIDLSGGPRRSAVDLDDSAAPDLNRVRKVLRTAERKKTIADGQRHHPIWATEFWWESYPDGGARAIPPLAKHGRWIEEALYLYWRAGAQVAIYYSLIDQRYDPDNRGSTLQAGLFLHDGTPKPAATAFAFPFTVHRTSGRKVKSWGKAPATGKLVVERKTDGGWRKIASRNVTAGKVFTDRFKVRGEATLRARVGGEQSLPWSLNRPNAGS